MGGIEFLSVIIFAISIFLGGKYCFLGLMVIVSLFGVFYAFSPFFVRFKRSNIKRKGKEEKQNEIIDMTSKKSGKDTDTEIFSN